jgi:hypothetical protein
LSVFLGSFQCRFKRLFQFRPKVLLVTLYLNLKVSCTTSTKARKSCAFYVPVPRGDLAFTVQEAVEAAKPRRPVGGHMQIHAGGRGGVAA